MIFDLKVRSQNGRFSLVLGSNVDKFRVDFDFTNGKAVANLTNISEIADKVVGAPNVPVAFHDGNNVVSFTNVDERLTLKVNGLKVYDFDYVPSEDWVSDYNSNTVSFSSEELSVTLSNIDIKRDIFYTRKTLNLDEIQRQQKEFRESGEIGYFCLGDNSPSSNDSRAWGFVKEKDILGMGLFVFYAGDKWVFDDWKFIK